MITAHRSKFSKYAPLSGLVLAALFASKAGLADQPDLGVNKFDVTNPAHPANSPAKTTVQKLEARSQARAAQPAPVITEEWAVQLQPGQVISDVAIQLGATDYRPLGNFADTYLVTLPDSSSRSRAASVRATLKNMPAVRRAEQQVWRQRSKRASFLDPLYATQWHLDEANDADFSNGSFPANIDANVATAWDMQAVDGTGVVIGIVDDGLEHTHPDLAANYLSSASYDYNRGDSDPAPFFSSDNHGTKVAGVAAAVDNNIADAQYCGVGAAYNAQLAGIQLISAATTDADEAAALDHNDPGPSNKSVIDIYNSSWGPQDYGEISDFAPDAEAFWLTEGFGSYPNAVAGAGMLALSALGEGVANGRGGKGVIYAWAGGNGLANNDNVNYDNFANSRFTIAVGAVDGDFGSQAGTGYSESGAALHVVAPSSSLYVGEGIRTTDRAGAAGDNSGSDTNAGHANCTSTFGGTSSSAPLAAGIVGLMLDANSNLGWRDVQHILAETAVKKDSGDGDWTTNGVGFDINHKYGFGLIDANAAVAAAKTWTNVRTATTVTSSVMTDGRAILDNNATGLTSTIEITEDIQLEHVEVVFNATHQFRGNLQIELISPDGTSSILSDVRLDVYDHISNWKFMTVRNWGEMSAGTWTIKVRDLENSNAQGYIGTYTQTGTFDDWQLILHGTTSGTAPHNFNADGRSDILWRHPSSGSNYIYQMDATGFAYTGGFIDAVASDWSVGGVGDFNGDGLSDILWRHTSGSNYIYLMDVTGFAYTGGFIDAVASDWSVGGVGDFNGDGRDDILWRHTSGSNYIYQMDATGFAYTGGFINSVASTWSVGSVGDFNGDGRDDILWRHPSSGSNYIYLMDATGFAYTGGFINSVAGTWIVADTGDFNGDGRSDILWRHPTSGSNYIYQMDATGFAYTGGFINSVEGTWNVALTGDFNGDGRDDILWRHPSSGSNYIYQMDATGFAYTGGFINSVAGTWTAN